MNPILFTKSRMNQISILLGTGMEEFETPFLQGLAREPRPDVLHVLAVTCNAPGNGHFRDFIAQAKNLYREIAIIEVWNAGLKAALARYGFQEEMIVSDDEENEAMIWRRAPAARPAAQDNEPTQPPSAGKE